MRKFYLLILCIFITSTNSCKKDEVTQLLDENYNPIINPGNFMDSVSNIFFPLTPGKKYTYSVQTTIGEQQSIEITVLSDLKTISGVKCTVVRDIVSKGGQVIEDTYDWFAQDKDGNVWYMGEDVSNYENGKLVDKEGSFEAGVDGAKPGIIMLSNPVLEMPYRQEYYFGKAEDWGKVIEKNLTVITLLDTFGNCIKTEDWSAIDPNSPKEYKYYAPGIGVVKEDTEDHSEVTEITKIE